MAVAAFERTRSDRRAILTEILVVLAITLVVAVPLRVISLDAAPPGLYSDEAAEGIDALAIWQDGARPVFLPSNNGREPLFAYVVAAVFALLGKGVVSLRLAAALIGIATIPATYLCARELFDRRIATLAGLILAVSGWHVHLSRVGMRSVALPLLAALTIWLLWRALRTGQWWAMVASGVMLGLSFYTYIPARLLPLVVVLGAVIWAVSYGLRRGWRRALLTVLVIAIVAGLVGLPLGLHFLGNPDDFLGRAGQVSIMNSSPDGSSLTPLLTENVGKTLGMFFFQGDTNPRHNLPGRPVFDPLLSLACVAGLLVVVRRIRQPGYVLGLLMVAVMLPPAVVSDSAPHFLRSAGLIPAICFLPAIGLAVAWDGGVSGAKWCRPWLRVALRPLVVGSILLAAGWTAVDVYYQWPRDERTPFEFDVSKLAAADYLSSLSTDARLYIGPMQSGDPGLQFLYPELPVRSFGWSSLLLPPNGAGAYYAVLGSDSGVMRWIREYYPGGQVSCPVENDTRLFSLIEVPPDAPAPAVAREGALASRVFDGWAKLRSVTVDPAPQVGGRVSMTLVWEALKLTDVDYDVFVHLIGPNGAEWANKTSQPGDGFQPTSRWATGDIVVDRWVVDAPPYLAPGEYRLRFGMVNPETGQRASITDSGGAYAGNELMSEVFRLEEPSRVPEAVTVPARQPMDVEFGASRGGELLLRGATIDTNEVMGGDAVGLVFFWQALEALQGDYDVVVRLEDASGDVKGAWRDQPAGGAFATTDWRVGRTVADRWQVVVPAGLPEGQYSLLVGLTERGSGRVLTVTPSGSDSAVIGTITVKDRDRQFEVPTIGHPLSARLGQGIELLGYDLSSASVKPGGTLKLTLYWRCLQPVEDSYKVFTHLLDGTNKVRAQDDGYPGQGERPTSGWIAGEVVVDEYELRVASDSPAGQHTPEIGMYLESDGSRLPITDESGRPLGDRVLLEPVVVTEQ